MSLLERGGERRRARRDRAGQEADPGRRRPRPLAVRAAHLPAPPLRLADAAARLPAARPGSAEADRGAQGPDRRRQGGGRGAARRACSSTAAPRCRSRASISPRSACPRISRAYLQSFAWLRDLSAAATRERGAKLAEQIMRKWLAAHAEQVSEPAWRADLWGRRILFWTAYAPYILSSADLVYRSSVLYALARGARHLERSADKALPGLPRITAWSGVIAAALVVQGGPARLKSGEAGLTRALGVSLHDDGGLVSRSPIEQLAAGRDARPAPRRLYRRRAARCPNGWPRRSPRRSAPARGHARRRRACRAGRAATWRAAAGSPPPSKAPALDVRPLRQARGWGYQRLQAKTTVLVFDAAPPPPPPRALAGGCASTLAFELSDGPDRLIVNCGGAGAAKGALPPRAGPRAAHHRRPFDADARRPQFDRDPRRRLARARASREVELVARRDRRHRPGRSEP